MNPAKGCFIVLFSFLSSGLITAVQATTGPKLEISVAHENKNQLKAGGSFWYAFNVTHAATSDADAKDVQITWYIPHYIRFGQLFGGNEDISVDLQGDVVVFKKPALVLGTVVNINFQASLANSSEVTEGHHYAVTMTTLIWYSSTSVKYTAPLASYSMEFVVPGCSEALGMENGEIRSHQLLATSSLPASRPDMARFNHDAWCAQTQDGNQFVQVLFSKKVKITKISTKGRSLKPHWVKNYSIRFSDDNINWVPYKENGFEKVFTGNNDLNSPVSHWLMYPISANYIRIHPISWNTQICMRFELYGCQISQTDNCVDPIGMEKGLIPNEALSDSDGAALVTPGNLRLNQQVNDFPFGWASVSNDPSKKDWVQADLGSIHKITSTAIQGSSNDPESLFYVKSYELQFSNNSVDWVNGKRSDTDRLFRGPESGEAAKFPTPAFFPIPVYARFVRLFPEEFYSMKVLRMEIYGCVSEESPALTNHGIPTEFSRRSTLLDKARNILYVCVYKEKRAETSCRMTKDGRTWIDIDSRIVNIIGYDAKTSAVYGLDHHMSYMYARDDVNQLIFISRKEWQRHQNAREITLSSKLNDILVGSNPKLNWTANTGHAWGVSGQGIHMKPSGSAWSLIASWKCCGF